MCFGRSVEASGSLSGGGGITGRSVDEGANSGVEGQPTRDQTVEVKAESLQRALANMRSKARTLRFEERDGVCSCVLCARSFAGCAQRPLVDDDLYPIARFKRRLCSLCLHPPRQSVSQAILPWKGEGTVYLRGAFLVGKEADNT